MCPPHLALAESGSWVGNMNELTANDGVLDANYGRRWEMLAAVTDGDGVEARPWFTDGHLLLPCS